MNIKLLKHTLHIILFISVSTFATFSQAKIQPVAPTGELSKTSAEVVSRLRHQHFQRTSIFINDDLSSTVLDRYIKELDRDHNYFLASDVKDFERYRYLLDDAFKTGNLKPAFTIFNRYQQRLVERIEFLLTQIDKGIDKLDFSKDDSLLLDREDQAWPTTIAEMDTLWLKRLKNDALNLELAGKPAEKIQELLHKRYSNQLKRIQQTDEEDAFRLYMNSLTLSYDPHTQYFSPRGTENFNIRMRLSLQGIGAMLQAEDEYTKVTRVIPAGPADKAGELKANDKIVGVGQGKEGEIVDVIGWRLDDVVDLIRGKKNTLVRLEIIPSAAADTQQTKIISITRDTVKLEEQAASKKIIELNSYGKKYKLGVIDIPKFYIDFEAASKGDPNYKSTTRDVKQLIQELKSENIDGIVIDLRDNGGGSLREVNELIGIFIKEGPTVQVKGVSGRIYVHEDDDPSITYTGPLAVLVNRLSASASEIFAGAIQDYHRGIVVGTQTYGKGTVQAMLPLHHGQITLTQQKFYRISGNSTQNRGVIPDINLPSLYDTNEIGESALEGALPWDKIRPARYKMFSDFSSIIPQLTRAHQERAGKDPDYTYLVKTTELIEKRRKKESISLNRAKRKADKKQLEQQQLVLENIRRKAKGMPLLKDIKELEKIAEEKDKDSDKKEESDEPTPLLTETGHILVDYIYLNQPSLVKK